MRLSSKTLGENVCFLVSRGCKLHRHVLVFDQVVEPCSSLASRRLLSELNYSRIATIGDIRRFGQDHLIQLAIQTQCKAVSPYKSNKLGLHVPSVHVFEHVVCLRRFRFAWSASILETFWVKHLLKKGIDVALLIDEPCALQGPCQCRIQEISCYLYLLILALRSLDCLPATHVVILWEEVVEYLGNLRLGNHPRKLRMLLDPCAHQRRMCLVSHCHSVIEPYGHHSLFIFLPFFVYPYPPFFSTLLFGRCHHVIQQTSKQGHSWEEGIEQIEVMSKIGLEEW